MKMKSIILVLVAAAFLLSLAGLSLAAGAEKMGVNGTVTKIEGTKVTVQDDMGKEMTVDVKDVDVKDTKVGDKVKIEDGVIKNPTDEPAATEKPGKPGY
jgi:outer membrane lipoprotein SlyB